MGSFAQNINEYLVKNAKPMVLFTKPMLKELAENHAKRQADPKFDPTPVCHLFAPYAGWHWLAVSMYPANERWGEAELLVVLADISMGCVEIGDLYLPDLRKQIVVERDIHWQPQGTLSQYYNPSAKAGRLVEIDGRDI